MSGPIYKTPPIESGKLTRACKGRECYLSFPGCDGGGESTVPCHSPFDDDNQGWAQKAHDFLSVPGCQHCHDLLDGRKAGIQRADAYAYFHRALKRWWETLFREGIITIKGMS